MNLSTNSEKIKSFLQPTYYCDCDNPKIKELALELTKNLQTDKEKAVVLFYWVRDKILYRVGLWNRKASETLAEGKGVCTSKANLLIAFLRTVGIPAGYGVMRVKGREYFGPIVPPFLQKRISHKSTHIYTCVYLNGYWLKCDPSDDKEFSEKTSYFNPQSKLVDWDGGSDAVIDFDKNHVFSDAYPLNNIDLIISKKPKTATNVIIKMGNLYIQFLRENSHTIIDSRQLELFFKSWLKKNHLFFYVLFFLTSWWLVFKNRTKLAKY